MIDIAYSKSRLYSLHQFCHPLSSSFNERLIVFVPRFLPSLKSNKPTQHSCTFCGNNKENLNVFQKAFKNVKSHSSKEIPQNKNQNNEPQTRKVLFSSWLHLRYRFKDPAVPLLLRSCRVTCSSPAWHHPYVRVP